jgi:hypothetical protein
MFFIGEIELVAGELLFRQPQGMQHCHTLSPGSRGLNWWSLISKVFAPDNIFGSDRSVLVPESFKNTPERHEVERPGYSFERLGRRVFVWITV